MKTKTNLLFVILLVLCIQAEAQTPWILTGNTPTGTDFLGTTNAFPMEIMTTNTTTPQPINFYTNNVFRATIDPNGLFGINTASPANLLHLFSPGATAAYMQVQNGGGAGMMLTCFLVQMIQRE